MTAVTPPHLQSESRRVKAAPSTSVSAGSNTARTLNLWVLCSIPSPPPTSHRRYKVCSFDFSTAFKNKKKVWRLHTSSRDTNGRARTRTHTHRGATRKRPARLLFLFILFSFSFFDRCCGLFKTFPGRLCLTVFWHHLTVLQGATKENSQEKWEPLPAKL